MITVSVDEIQRDFLAYLERVAAGERVLVIQGEKPMAELAPVACKSDATRQFGLCAGEFRVPDDFDAPLPVEVLREFMG
jgi:antitoxin (DNA-binding transcriptional repressor) of toxin-antitoxin stability system